MKQKKYHVYLDCEESKLLINSLNDLRNKLITGGRYTGFLYEVLIKVANAKAKKIRMVSKYS